MEETLPPEPSLATPALDPSIAELITGLEKQVITNMDSIVDQLRSLQQAGSLDNTTLKEQVHQVLGLAKASLVIRTLPILLNTLTITFSLETSELFKKIHDIAETLKTLWKEQSIQAINQKAAQFLERIRLKEQQVKQKIELKQQAISQGEA
jgi:hypothetical protein